MTASSDGSRPPGRGLRQRVSTARRRRASSTRWLERQLNDPYVAGAKSRGWRSRAAYKLLQLDDRFRLLKPGARVVDLGAAPGGWSQVAAQRAAGGPVVAVDLLDIADIPGVRILKGDATDVTVLKRIRAELGGPADLVLSDMAAAATGHRGTDHLRTMALAEAAWRAARALLAPGGGFVAKVLRGGADDGLLARLKRDFRRVVHAKPEASRQESREIYVVATGFRGDSEGC